MRLDKKTYDMAKRIYVGNLPVKIDRKQLEKYFTSAGEAWKPIRLTDLDPHARKATLEIGGDAKSFVSQFDGKSIGNTVISVREG
jgi:hypothetical protein